MKYKFKIKHARYKDGSKSPWWKIEIYKNNKLYNEMQTQYSSLFDAIVVWLRATLYSFTL